MRLDQDQTSAFNTFLKSVRYSHSRKILSADVAITQNGSIVNALDANGTDRTVTLPPFESGRAYVIVNCGDAGNLNVVSFTGAAVATIVPNTGMSLFAGDDTWTGVGGTATGTVFGPVGPTHSTGLVPDPGPGSPSSPHRYLAETGVWETVAGLVASNAYFFTHKGGAVTLTPVGSEGIEFTSANTAISILASSATTPKSIGFTLNAANINHDVLFNYVSDQHVAHSGVTLTAGLGISGGGTIAASRTFDFAPTELTAATPALTDFAVWDLAAGGPRKALWSAVNGIIDHNLLLNYSANRHIDHSTVSIVASTGLSGGGDLTTSRSLALDINGLTTDTPASGDLIAFFDISGTDTNKCTMASAISAGGGVTEAPNDGVKYARRSLAWSSIPNITVSSSAPGSPAVNDVWIDTT
jgi:hypothetical protein